MLKQEFLKAEAEAQARVFKSGRQSSSKNFERRKSKLILFEDFVAVTVMRTVTVPQQRWCRATKPSRRTLLLSLECHYSATTAPR